MEASLFFFYKKRCEWIPSPTPKIIEPIFTASLAPLIFIISLVHLHMMENLISHEWADKYTLDDILPVRT